MSPSTFVRFAWSTLAVTVVVILWGAVVRATGSGAGCGSHWPLCNGAVVPLSPAAGTVIEYIHRVTSGAAMLLSLGLMVGARRVFPAGHRARTWALASFAVMLVEAALGAGLVVLGLVEGNTSALRAAYIAAHLANTMVLTGLMTGTIWWASQPAGAAATQIRRSRGLAVTAALTVVVAATTKESADKAIHAIERITEVPEIGKTYTATVKKVTDFGAFVEFLPGKEGLVHISQLDTKRVAKVTDVAKVGDVIEVKITDKDDQGRWKLSRRALLEPEGESSSEQGGRPPDRRPPPRHHGGHGPRRN